MDGKREVTARNSNTQASSGLLSQGRDKSTGEASKQRIIRAIFAYGVWIWKPEFRYKDLSVGVALGFSRQLYQGSQSLYGTPAMPGRIATIVPNPSAGTLGCIYRLSRRHMERDLAALDATQEPLGYRRGEIVVENCSTGRADTCWTFIARQGRENPFWLGKAEPSDIAFQVVQARGRHGDNLDYVRRLVDFVRLQTRGVIDRDLDTKRVLRLAEQSGQHQHENQSCGDKALTKGREKSSAKIDVEKSTVFHVREEHLSQLREDSRLADAERKIKKSKGGQEKTKKKTKKKKKKKAAKAGNEKFK